MQARIVVDGKAVKFALHARGGGAGIATVYQELLLFPELTVAENIFLGHYPRRPPGGSTGPRSARARRELLDQLDTSDLDVDTKVVTLSVAKRQRVEIAKALSRMPAC